MAGYIIHAGWVSKMLVISVRYEEQAETLLNVNLLYILFMLRHTHLLTFPRKLLPLNPLDGMSDQDIQTCFATQCMSETNMLLGCGMADHSLCELCFKCLKFPMNPAPSCTKWSLFILTFLTWCIASIARDFGTHNSGASSFVCVWQLQWEWAWGGTIP
jgi:hypothetical protein